MPVEEEDIFAKLLQKENAVKESLKVIQFAI